MELALSFCFFVEKKMVHHDQVQQQYLASPYASQQAATASPNPASAASILPSLRHSKALASRGFTVSMRASTSVLVQRYKDSDTQTGLRSGPNRIIARHPQFPPRHHPQTPQPRLARAILIFLHHEDGSKREWARPCFFAMTSTLCLEDMPGIVCDNGTGFVKVCFGTTRTRSVVHCSFGLQSWLGFFARAIAPNCCVSQGDGILCACSSAEALRCSSV